MQKGEILKQSRENLEWFNENYESLKKEYDNQWIVIQQKKVVAKGSTYTQIKKILGKSDMKNALIEFMDSKQIAMFF
jgi:hypothetical protein